MSAFQTPGNRTKTLYAQINSGRPQAARQKLGSVEGSQSVLNAQTNAQQGENSNVTQQTQTVTDTTKKGVENVGMAPVFAAGNAAVADAKVVAGQKPVFVTSVTGSGGIAAPSVSGRPTPIVDDGTLKKEGDAAVATNKDLATGIDKSVDTSMGTLSPYHADVLTEDLGKRYDAESDILSASERELTEGNLGLLAPESDFEIQQAQNAQVLAERDSNIGKLRNLYGVGYDSSKYGALDSNLLQGQFNDAAVSSQDALKNKELAQRGGEQVRQAYAENIDKSKGLLSDAKVESEKKITQLSGEVTAVENELAALKARAGTGGTETNAAIAALEKHLAIKRDNLAKLIKTTTDTRGQLGKTGLVSDKGLSQYAQTVTDPKEIKAISDFAAIMDSAPVESKTIKSSGTVPFSTNKSTSSAPNKMNPEFIKKAAPALANLSADALDSMSTDGMYVNAEIVRAAMSMTKDARKQAILEKLLDGQVVNERAATADDKQRQAKLNSQQRKTEAIVSGGGSELARAGQKVWSAFGGK